MRSSEIPLATVSTAIGMIWDWHVMTQGFFNDPAYIDRLVTQLFRPHRGYAQTNFITSLYIVVHHGRYDVYNHFDLLRSVIECMRTNRLY